MKHGGHSGKIAAGLIFPGMDPRTLGRLLDGKLVKKKTWRNAQDYVRGLPKPS
jgi:hypothetical protein